MTVITGLMRKGETTVEARCPLCGASILSIGRGGRVEVHETQAFPLYRGHAAGGGFLVCDECAALAQRRDLSLN